MRLTKKSINNILWILFTAVACFLTVYYFLRNNPGLKVFNDYLMFGRNLFLYVGVGITSLKSRKSIIYIFGVLFILFTTPIVVFSFAAGIKIYNVIRLVLILFCLYFLFRNLISTHFAPAVRLYYFFCPGNKKAVYKMSYLLLEKGNYEQAARYAEQAIEMDKTYDFAKYVLGISLYYQEKYIKAKEILNEISLKGMREEIQCIIFRYLGIIDMALEAYESALSYFKSELKISSNDKDLLFYQAGCLSHLDNEKAAIGIYSRLIELDQNLGVIYYNRGTVYYQIGKKELAEEDWKVAVNVLDPYFDGYASLGYLEYDRGNIEKSLDYYREGIKRNESLREYLPADLKDRIQEV